MSMNLEEEEEKVEESAHKKYPSYQVVENSFPDELPESQPVSLKKPKEARPEEMALNSDYNQINMLPQESEYISQTQTNEVISGR